MKLSFKSKFIKALTIGGIALSAVAITTPILVSCSSTENPNNNPVKPEEKKKVFTYIPNGIVGDKNNDWIKRVEDVDANAVVWTALWNGYNFDASKSIFRPDVNPSKTANTSEYSAYIEDDRIIDSSFDKNPLPESQWSYSNYLSYENSREAIRPSYDYKTKDWINFSWENAEFDSVYPGEITWLTNVKLDYYVQSVKKVLNISKVAIVQNKFDKDGDYVYDGICYPLVDGIVNTNGIPW